MTNWTDLTYAVVDVEGNGQQPPELVELAIVPIVKGAILEPQSWLVKPSRPIRNFATRIHGLTNRDVENAPTFAEIQDEVCVWLDADALVAHNAHVDVAVLARHLDGWQPKEVFDTLKLARRLLPSHTTYKLGSLVDAFKLADGLSETLSPHRATYDALVTARLFVRLAGLPDTRPLSLEELRGAPPEEGEGGDREADTLF